MRAAPFGRRDFHVPQDAYEGRPRTPGNRANVEWRSGERDWFANSESGWQAALSDVVLGEDGSLSFSFLSETLVAMKDGAAVEGLSPVPISGRFEGRLPAKG